MSEVDPSFFDKSSRKIPEFHVLGSVEDPEAIAERVIENSSPGAVVIDLSAGQLGSPHRPHRHLRDDALENVTWINGQHFAPRVGDSSRDAYVKWLSDAANKPVAHGASVKEWFTYRGEISLWWFTELSLKHPNYRPHQWMFYQYFVLDHILNTENDVKGPWHLWTSESESDMLRGALPSSASVTIHSPRETDRSSKKSSLKEQFRGALDSNAVGESILVVIHVLLDVLRTFSHLLKILSRKTGKVSESKYFDNKRPEDRNRPLVVFSSLFPSSWTSVPDSVEVSDNVDKYDHYFGDAPYRLRDYGFSTGWLTSATISREQVEGWKNIKKNQPILDITPWMYLDNSDIMCVVWHQVKWALTYIYIFIYLDITKKWKYKGVKIGHWFKSAFKRSWASWDFAYIEQYKNMYKKIEPNIVLYKNEFGTSGRRISAALKKHTNLVGVQHGMISRDHTEYQWYYKDIQGQSSENKPDHVHYAPVPDYISAFGSYYVSQFNRWNGYPADQVVPIGALRHDILVEQFQLDKSEEARAQQKAELREEYNLPQDRPILLLCTAIKRTAGPWFEMTVQSVRQCSFNPFIAVKLHQYHGGEQDVRRVSEEQDYSSFEVYNKDIYPLMAAADILISGASTTILEGNLFDLSCVAICATTEYKAYPFVRDELATVADDVESMAEAIQESHRATKTGSPVKKEKLAAHLKNVQGKSTGRLGKFLDSIIHKTNTGGNYNEKNEKR